MPEIETLTLDEAKARRDEGDATASRVLSAQRPTVRYEPQEWELALAEDRIAFYQGLDAIGQVREASREALPKLVLSFESILRRYGVVGFHTKKDYWQEKISDRVPKRFVERLTEADLLVRIPLLIGKKPYAYEPSQALLDAIPAVPEGLSEGKLISDKHWEPIEIRKVADARFGQRNIFDDEEGIAQEVVQLNEWYAENANRITGVDDLRFHRIFHGNIRWGGRLYGQFTSMHKTEQRPFVRIDGEGTTEADLNASYLSFFLLLSGMNDIPNDPYQHGALSEYPRPLVKSLFLHLLGRGEWWSRRYPPSFYNDLDRLGCPEGLPPLRELREIIIDTYPVFNDFNMFRPTLWIERYESRALLNTLAWLREQGEIGLPIHDGIRVHLPLLERTKAEFCRQMYLVCAGRQD